MKTWKIIALIVVIGGIAGAVVAYAMYNKPHKNYEKASVDYEITANALFDELEADPAALEKYNAKVLEVTGKVQEVQQSADGNTSIYLEAENAMMGGVNARMALDYLDDEEYKNTLTSLQPGSEVTLKCRFQGFEQDLITEVKLDNCYIVQ